MANSRVPKKKSNSRVFIIPFRAGPERVPQYMDWAAAGGIEQNLGDSTRIEAPSMTEYDAYDVVGEVPGATENPTIDIMFQERLALSTIQQLAARGCPIDIQIHSGKCRDPRDFDGGWDVIDVVEASRATKYAKDESGALSSSDNDKINETVSYSGLNLYQIGPMTYAERATTDVTAKVIKMVVCDKPSCGECGDVSDGCKKIFAILAPAGTSPGLTPEVVYTDDGYTTSGVSPITTLLPTENPSSASCVGDNLVVVSQTTESLHYAPTADILDGSASWSEVTTGFVAAHGPNAIDSFSPRDTWIVGQGGYIYFTTDPTNGVDIQDAGVATTQNLLAVSAFDSQTVVAVGASNAVVYTENGGEAWGSVTGPEGGASLTSVGIRSESEWWVTTSTGKLWYTLDKGAHWTQKNVPGSGSGSLNDIVWASDSVGFLAQTTATPSGRILRTINGGYSWYVAPESSRGRMPSNKGINSLAVCIKEVNVVYGGGLSSTTGDGFIVKGSS